MKRLKKELLAESYRQRELNREIQQLDVVLEQKKDNIDRLKLANQRSQNSLNKFETLYRESLETLQEKRGHDVNTESSAKGEQELSSELELLTNEFDARYAAFLQSQRTLNVLNDELEMDNVDRSQALSSEIKMNKNEIERLRNVLKMAKLEERHQTKELKALSIVKNSEAISDLKQKLNESKIRTKELDIEHLKLDRLLRQEHTTTRDLMKRCRRMKEQLKKANVAF